jgi:hypothetical protein
MKPLKALYTFLTAYMPRYTLLLSLPCFMISIYYHNALILIAGLVLYAIHLRYGEHE